jgi:hypothetical protein
MKWYVANRYFCEHSETAQKLFRNQASFWAVTLPPVSFKNHKKMCKDWIKKEERLKTVPADEVGQPWTGNRFGGSTTKLLKRAWDHMWRDEEYADDLRVF